QSGTQFNLGLASIRMGDLDNAKVYLDKALQLNPLTTDAQRLMPQTEQISRSQSISGS
ncbi:MAG: tetratricopeptide repeat protein, partial [Actinobacteria bacterium]|nr:tetratricopeptide repeat protein [Actinomycetota bacterium]